MEWYARRPGMGALLTALVLAAGCGGEEDSESATASAEPESVGTTPTASSDGPNSNRGPQISGKPRDAVSVGEVYFFVPTSKDADGDDLLFRIQNQPEWLAFDAASGALSGIPTAADAGHYADVTILVSDGLATTMLSPFSVEVVPGSIQSAFLTWIPPTEYEDGSPLFELAGYRVRYGSSSGSYSELIDIGDPNTTVLGLDFLSPDTYYFVITAYSYEGAESAFSNEAVVSLN